MYPRAVQRTYAQYGWRYFLKVVSRGFPRVCGWVWVPQTCPQIFGLQWPRARQRNGLKVYLVSYTNKSVDLKAVFEISYFQTTQKPKSPICYPYGPTKLSGKSWGHAASLCLCHKASNLRLHSIKVEKMMECSEDIWRLHDLNFCLPT